MIVATLIKDTVWFQNMIAIIAITAVLLGFFTLIFILVDTWRDR